MRHTLGYRVLPLIVVLLLALPLGASAVTGGKPIGSACLYNSECASGSCSWIPNGCVAGSGGGSYGGGGGGGINIFYIQQYSNGIIGIINAFIVPVLMAVAFPYFLFRVYTYFIATDDHAKGRDFVLYAVIGFAAIFSVWGLVAIVINTFGLGAGGLPPPYPTL